MSRFSGALVLVVVATMGLGGCGTPADHTGARPSQGSGEKHPWARPTKFTIVPDRYHVPYAGTAEDGRKFFLSEELFAFGSSAGRRGSSYVGLYLWKPDGSFDRVEVDKVERPQGRPPGQAAPAGAEDLVRARLDELGDYKREPITVEPFVEEVEGVKFGWHVGRYDDGEYYINIVPGDFVCYYAPWDGIGYDT